MLVHHAGEKAFVSHGVNLTAYEMAQLSKIIINEKVISSARMYFIHLL